MLTSWLRTIGPALEPVTLAQAKAHCRVTTDNDDALFATYIQAAREYAERQTSRSFLQQTWRLSLGHFPRFSHRVAQEGFRGYESSGYSSGYGCGSWSLPSPILLPQPPLIGIGDVTYLDPNGTRQTLDPTLYTVNGDAEPSTILPAPGTWWPATLPGQSNAVQVTYVAGYGNAAAAVPAAVQLAILGLVAAWYENRESVVLTNSTDAVTVVPQFVDSLLDSVACTAFTYEA